MNIFVLNQTPELSAKDHCDKHVVKMILESAQLLSTAHRIIDDLQHDDRFYKVTHKNHPCAIWTRASTTNYLWLFRLFESLLNEYQLRYKKVHASSRLQLYLQNPPQKLLNDGLTPFALAMPEVYRSDDPVASYRAYYKHEKRAIASWKHSITPDWWHHD